MRFTDSAARAACFRRPRLTRTSHRWHEFDGSRSPAAGDRLRILLMPDPNTARMDPFPQGRCSTLPGHD